VAALGALVAFAMVVYFAVAILIGGADIGMIRRNIKRKAANDKTAPESGD
jgi:putative peptidoglycan lipid II flippase